MEPIAAADVVAGLACISIQQSDVGEELARVIVLGPVGSVLLFRL